ncbi:uncharacterized protein LOC134957938 isoform X2 [Pseudophryne corroboree]|uniref:uncharacterized protein LOC134957938 isoform X2 n=1 Tax=Pseudophryne corroboree TaxID=495146 RepID=UPI0030817B40
MPPQQLRYSPPRFSPQSPHLPVSKKTHTPSGHASTLSEAEDDADGGTSSAIVPPRRRSLGVTSRPPLQPSPRRCISLVSPMPPQQLRYSPPRFSPQSPHLPEDTNQTESDTQQQQTEDTFTLQLMTIPPPYATPTDLPTQTQPQTPEQHISPSIAMSPSTDQAFWSTWATQQAHTTESLTKQTQALMSLAHHMPHLCRSNSR